MKDEQAYLGSEERVLLPVVELPVVELPMVALPIRA
jgi:hypothetical protein